MIDVSSPICLVLKEMCAKIGAARLGDLIVRRSVAATCDLIDFYPTIHQSDRQSSKWGLRQRNLTTPRAKNARNGGVMGPALCFQNI